MWVRLGATAVAAVVVAEAAAWLLRPRDIERPVHADENSYFSGAELTKARDYASGQRLILVGSLIAEGAVLVLLATGRPAVTRRALERLGARPVLGGAAAAAGLSVVVAVVTIPFGDRRARALGGRRPLHAVTGKLAERLGQGDGDRGSPCRARRDPRPRADPALRQSLVDPGQRGGGGGRRALHLGRAGAPGAALQQVRAAARRAGAQRRARARPQGRRRRRRRSTAWTRAGAPPQSTPTSTASAPPSAWSSTTRSSTTSTAASAAR